MKLGDQPIIPVSSETMIFHWNGLTKRELFAALAMQGLLPNYRPERSQEGDAALASLSVMMSDALIAELEKNPTEPAPILGHESTTG